MTWHLGARLSALLGLLTALVAVGCGDDDDGSAKVEITSPERDAELTIADDADDNLADFQYDVKAKVEHIAEGSVMLLRIEGQTNALVSAVDENQEVVFEKATLPPGTHKIHVARATGSPTSEDDYSYTLKTLVIETPRDGSGIAFGDDLDDQMAGVQINVKVKAYAVDGAQELSLAVDDVVGEPLTQNADGEVVFEGVTLDSGLHTLKAIAGDIESSVSTISVNEACATINFISPAEPETGDRITLGGGDECPDEGPFKTTVEIATDAGDGRDVQLWVNGLPVATTTVNGAKARFNDVVLTRRRMTANEISVSVQGENGVTCAPEPFPAGIFVDCDGSDCSIASPIPYANDGKLYLNQSMQNGSGFDIRVDSDPSVLGKKIQLIVDGRDGKNALSEDPGPSGNRVSALFKGIKLSDGPHVIEARCTDTQNNATESGEQNWFVDTEDCPVEITSPENNALFVEEDDADPAADKIQVELSFSVDGSECTGQRAAPCDPDVGIEREADEPEFDAFEGSPVTRNVTLDNVMEQTLCAEAVDRAHNVSRDSVTVRNRAILPNVQIESPEDATVFNAAGGNGRAADSDMSTPVCNADFVVLCSEVGTEVELRRDSGTGAVVASGDCEAASGLPEGFEGRATLGDVAFLAGSATEGTFVATQTLTAESNRTLVGVSAPLSLTGQCQVPRLSFTSASGQGAIVDGCLPAYLQLPDSGNLMSTLGASYTGMYTPPASASLKVEAGSMTLDTQTADVTQTRNYEFPDVGFGNMGRLVTVTLSATDGFGNSADRVCTTTLTDVNLTVVSPADDAILGPTQGCVPTDATKFGIPFQITVDQTADRELVYTVGNATAVPVTLTGTSQTVCVPAAADGNNEVEFTLTSSATSSEDVETRTVTVHSIDITAPADGAAITTSVCTPAVGTAGVTVTAATAPNATGTVLFTAGSNMATGAIASGVATACVPVAQGSNMIRAEVQGTGQNDTITVSVFTTAPGPTTALTVTSYALPSAAGPTYRDGAVTINWSALTPEFAGQFNAYAIKCANRALSAAASDVDKNAWWTAYADTVTPTANVVPPATSANVTFRTGEERHCVVRAYNTAAPMVLSAIGGSLPANYVFRETAVSVAGGTFGAGRTVTRIGDVSGDGIADLLVGGLSRAYLYLGGATLGTAPTTTFSAINPFVPSDAFGTRTVGLGDINGDNVNDFAIGWPEYSESLTDQNLFNFGMVYVFFGRPTGTAWPASVQVWPLTGGDPDGSVANTFCPADLCFAGSSAFETVGAAIAALGNFSGDSDAVNDFAIGAPARDSSPATNGHVYIVRGRNFTGSTPRPGGTGFFGTRFNLPDPALPSFQLDGTGPISQLGSAIVGVGDVGATDGASSAATPADLVLSAAGTGAGSSSVFRLNGRPYTGGVVVPIAASDLTLVDQDATPSRLGSALTAYRNFFDPSYVDLGVGFASSDGLYVYLGGAGGALYSAADRITVLGAGGQFANSGFGAPMTFNPSLTGPQYGDLDGDGRDDLIIGSFSAAGNAAAAGPLYLFYSAVVTARLTTTAPRTITTEWASQVNPAARTGATERTAQLVGDLNGDGKLDIVLGESGEPTFDNPDANGGAPQDAVAGGFTILY